MSALSDRWKQLEARYAGLSRREKLLLAGALIIVPALLVETLVLDAQRTRNRALERSVVQESASASALQAEVLALQQQVQRDPDAAAKAEIAALKLEQRGLESELQQLGTTLVPPEQMNALLERLLARHAGLRLISLKTLKPQSVLGDPDAPAGGAAKPANGSQPEPRFDLYRHGVEIRLEGSFAELEAYLVQLEQSPQRLLWGQLQYEVIAYPKAEMSLMVYTLSADRSWLAL
jgi:MSHA biogenesis protein MshJ